MCPHSTSRLPSHSQNVPPELPAPSCPAATGNGPRHPVIEGSGSPRPGRTVTRRAGASSCPFRSRGCSPRPSTGWVLVRAASRRGPRLHRSRLRLRVLGCC